MRKYALNCCTSHIDPIVLHCELRCNFHFSSKYTSNTWSTIVHSWKCRQTRLTVLFSLLGDESFDQIHLAYTKHDDTSWCGDLPCQQLNVSYKLRFSYFSIPVLFWSLSLLKKTTKRLYSAVCVRFFNVFNCFLFRFYCCWTMLTKWFCAWKFER